MNRNICNIKGCLNEGRYCRLHQVETFTPAKKINKESYKQKELTLQYKKVAKRFITLHPRCQVKDCNKISECIHHQRGRVGDLLLDTRHFMAVCMDHHRQIEDHPEWAKENGSSSSRLKVSA
jgi:hypothetical protein